jgi:hypothetical protein
VKHWDFQQRDIARPANPVENLPRLPLIVWIVTRECTSPKRLNRSVCLVYLGSFKPNRKQVHARIVKRIPKQKMSVQPNVWVVQQVGRPIQPVQNAKPAKPARMQQTRVMSANLVELESTVKANKQTIQTRLRIQLFVWVVQQGGRRTKVVQNANRAKQVHSVTSKVKYANLVQKESTVKAKKRTMTPRLRIQLSVWVVQQGGRRTKVVQNAKLVVQVRTVLDAILVKKVRIGMAVIQLLRRVENVRLAITVTTLGKAPAFPAFLVNTMPKLAQ